ncbi:uncharacterized protein [Zea mays]|uniref:Reactive oxygen species modulator 1 n=1 Tax=Zea mays TaxID=4577 RepID=A0A1D6JG25_MAIZE|nr:uncharacterized protein LOC100272875 isoform X1 [Zea mays]AQK46686.1 Reactive oxygen species modulator 1 [Zea mays]AQK46687.1 Reactive oxygen species modulator 1 [Zea mays]|eukprot:XP_020400520.1 uncharacterized protein LOC100272875 isoform X1 [Zea mays]
MLRGAVVGSDGADLRRRQVRGPSGAAGRSILAAKFGTKFVSAASILRSGCGINAKIPGLLKIRYIGQTTVGSAAIFGLFLGAGSLIHCGKSY